MDYINGSERIDRIRHKYRQTGVVFSQDNFWITHCS